MGEDLRDAVLADGPVAGAEAVLLGCGEDVGEVVGEAEGDAGLGGGFAGEAGVFCAEVDGCAGELGRVEEGVAVGLVKGRAEEGGVDGFEEDGRVDALGLGEDEGLREGLDHRGDHEVAAEFEGVGLVGFGADDGDAAGEGFEEGAGEVDGGGGAGCGDPELGGCGDVGAAEDRGGDVELAAVLVGLGDALGEGDADGGECDVDGTGGEGGEEAVGGEEDGFVGFVVHEHGEDGGLIDCCGGGGGGDGGERGEFGCEGVGAAGGAVPKGDGVAGGEEVAGDGCAHFAEAEEGDVHV